MMSCVFIPSAKFSQFNIDDNTGRYDYHGPWDRNVSGQDSVSNPQSSIKVRQRRLLINLNSDPSTSCRTLKIAHCCTFVRVSI